MALVERATGIEPVYPAWRASVLSDILRPQIDGIIIPSEKDRKRKEEREDKNLMVPRMGLEPTRSYNQRIFLLLHVTMASLLSCSLDYVLTISFDLGCWCIVSTHLEKNCRPATSYTYPFIWSMSTAQLLFFSFSTAFCSRLLRLASFYSKSFLLGTLYDFS